MVTKDPILDQGHHPPRNCIVFVACDILVPHAEPRPRHYS